MNSARSIGAVIAGAVTGIVLSLGTDGLLRATGVFPALGQPMAASLFALATAYRIAYGIAGAYVTARLAPQHPMKHAMVLGAFGTLASLGGVVVAWNAPPEFGPLWYPIALVATGLPCAWAGAKLYRVRS